MSLPEFRYYPNPLENGAFIESENECICCRQKRGYIYSGITYSAVELHECLCPWCIESGSAHEKFEAEFTDYSGIGNYGEWEEIPKSLKEIVAFRTPGFSGWQQERWWTHCNDAAEYLGAAGKKEILVFGEQLQISLKNEAGYNDSEWEHYFEALSKNDSPTAYVFRCLHCGELGGYSDSH